MWWVRTWFFLQEIMLCQSTICLLGYFRLVMYLFRRYLLYVFSNLLYIFCINTNGVYSRKSIWYLLLPKKYICKLSFSIKCLKNKEYFYFVSFFTCFQTMYYSLPNSTILLIPESFTEAEQLQNACYSI